MSNLLSEKIQVLAITPTELCTAFNEWLNKYETRKNIVKMMFYNEALFFLNNTKDETAKAYITGNYEFFYNELYSVREFDKSLQVKGV